jgi:hypothetical protein
MIQKLAEVQHEATQAGGRPRRLTRGLQALLWLLWTSMVVAGGYLGWRADTLAGRPLSILGMAISAGTAGLIGLIVLTLIEMRIEPWRFLE